MTQQPSENTLHGRSFLWLPNFRIYMKKYFVLLVFSLFCSFTTQAQRFGYINSQYIIEKMPEYGEAKQELDRLSAEWQEQLEARQQLVRRMRVDFEAEKVLFTEEMKQKRLAEIELKEKDVRDYQTKVFGFDGLLFQKRSELIKPVQDKIFEASARVARKRKLAILFDRASDLSMVYADPTHDYTENVLEELGLVQAAGK